MIPAIIPARGGSKGVPKKNVRTLCGKPLIAWTIEHAERSKHVSEVIVATDDSDIGAIAMNLGAKVHWRSKESATDESPSEVVLREVAIGRFSGAEAIVFLQCTSPLRQPHDIDGAIEKFREEGADSCFSARKIEGFTWKLGPGVISPTYARRLRRQDLHVHTIEENGSIYVFKPQVLATTGRVGGKTVAYLMDPLDSFQIDEEEDFARLEKLMRIRGGRYRAEAN